MREQGTEELQSQNLERPFWDISQGARPIPEEITEDKKLSNGFDRFLGLM